MYSHPPDQNPQTPRDRSNAAIRKELKQKAPWLIVAGIAGLLLCTIIYFIIMQGSSLITTLATAVAEWFQDASLNPTDAAGFENFIRLVLLAGAFIVAAVLLKR